MLVLSETVSRARHRIGAILTEHFFDHDRLDVYRLSIEYVAAAFASSRSLEGLHRHARDPWLRAAHSIPLNIAEGNGKRGLKDRARFLDIARGSALECTAIQDVLVVPGGISSNCRDVDSDGDEIRWCLGMIERVQSVIRLRA